MRSSNEPIQTENMISETKANRPAVTRSPAASNPIATTAMTKNTSADQPKNAPSECSDDSQLSNATAATRTTNAPA